MKKTIIVGLGLALSLALIATVALAWGPGFGPGFGRGSVGPAYGSPPIPNLTSEQSAQIQALRDAFLKEIEPLRNDLWTKRTELQTLWADPKTDPAVITAKQKEIWDLQSQLQEKAANLALNIRKFADTGAVGSTTCLWSWGRLWPPWHGIWFSHDGSSGWLVNL